MTNYIRTFTGRFFLTDPSPDCVDISDIAHALSRTCRWGGHCKKRYSVAAHSIHVSKMVPKKYRLQALLHDASEAYLCDIPAPFKALLPDYKELERKIMQAVAEKLEFSLPLHESVKTADAVALYLERRDLFTHPVLDDVPKVSCRYKTPWDFEHWCSLKDETVEDEFKNLYYAYKY